MTSVAEGERSEPAITTSNSDCLYSKALLSVNQDFQSLDIL